MTSLQKKIIERILLDGPMSFETFMEMALFTPNLGYYQRESAAIGRGGDFYTSSHLHEIFGVMIGRQIEEMWELMDRPNRFIIAEIGAGMGYVAKDLLAFLKSRDIFPSLRYVIVELNGSVKMRQQALLREFSDAVQWVTDIVDLDPITGCFFSNELLDSFPVRVVEMHDELREVFVTLREDSFAEVTKSAGAEVREYFGEAGIVLPKGYRTEVNLRMREWLQKVSEHLLEGFVFTIDYGYPAWDYYSEERARGTLLCYHHHQVSENPYAFVGEQDITAHVNFTALNKWGQDVGLRTIGYAPQGVYLISLGIDEVLKEHYKESSDSFELAKIKGLILPQGMGESHKVIVQYKGGGEPVLRGFSLRDQKEVL